MSGAKCPECGGDGIQFRGRGSDLQSKVCSRWKEPGHPSKEEITAKYQAAFNAHAPSSGRFA